MWSLKTIGKVIRTGTLFHGEKPSLQSAEKYQNLLTRKDCIDILGTDRENRATGRKGLMGTEKRYCSICAWRGTCAKRFFCFQGCQREGSTVLIIRGTLEIKDHDIDGIINQSEHVELQGK